MQGKMIKPSSSTPNQTNWQSIFQPEGYNMSYGMMEQDQKNKISHRYKALMLFVDYLYKTDQTIAIKRSKYNICLNKYMKHSYEIFVYLDNLYQ
ncbi:Ham1-like family protein [Cardinium endosymbiont of Oedothorax gibbosus]|nr:Ham1-like family protein [Cardinium endosymbiont of Oedothorax gibbosus]